MKWPIKWIDAHCHLADPILDETRAELLKKSESLGITHWIQGGVDPDDWTRQEALKKIWGEQIITCFGLHPWWVVTHSREELEHAFAELEQRATHASILGEMGLDQSRRLPPAHASVSDGFKHQKTAFRYQLKLASQLGKPVILHIVRAHEEALQILEKEAISGFSGLVHSFSGVQAQAKRYIDLGLTISVSGGVAQKGFQSMKKAVKLLPKESLVVETDSPDQPLPGLDGLPGALNEPSELIRVAQAVGEIRSESYTAVLDQSAANLRRVFKL